MATEAQINANRQNAQKSTGPVTDEGKAIVSQNALKHGLFAVQDVVLTENQEQFDSMREQMLADLAPVGAMETLLAQRAFSLAWRLQRAETMQAQVTQDMVESHIVHEQVCLGRKKLTDPRYAPDYLVLGRIAKEDWRSSKLIERLFEYERRIEKSLYKTMSELRAMQAARRMAQAEAQKQEKPNSEKQSQSESTCEKLPDRLQRWPSTFGIDPNELTAFLKKTYGDRYPEMVKVILNRHNGAPAQPPIACSTQVQDDGKDTTVPSSTVSQ